jgi:transposase
MRTSGGRWPGSAELIGRLFHVSYTLRGVSYLLHRNGFTPQVPAHRGR